VEIPAEAQVIPIVRFNEQKAGDGNWPTGGLAAAADALKSKGCLWLQGVFPPPRIDALRASFMADHFARLNAEDGSADLLVGDKRLMVPVELKGEFNDSGLYAQLRVSALMREALGADFRLGGFGVVVSLPGAREQHIHCDHPALFGTSLDDFLPSFAVTMIVPLVDLNALTGTTRMWEGSHLARYHAVNAETPLDKRDHQDPYANVGDCLLMDFRLYHAGLENRSDNARPILYVTYFRPWFKDYVNYKKHAPLVVGAGEFEKIPSGLRPLFANAVIQR
jgi:ectoine hydroxylase-related dioxygenase (phytanoyl-CoA dioxygenase family)